MPQRCKPPPAGKLAVANSGGPDSTCLSFLLNDTLRKIKERGVKTDGWFGQLISLNVDHQFQPRSSEMPLKTSENFRRLVIPYKTLQMPWHSPYVVKPSPEQFFERIARDARYTLLLSGMHQYGADTIAFGHHADDQLETLLMRFANGHTSRSNTTEDTNERRTPWSPLVFSDGIESLQSLPNDYVPKIGIETEAHTLLRGCAVPLPPSTILLSQDKLSQITNSFVQRSTVIQILRSASPHPWGSYRRSVSKGSRLDRIVASPFYNASNDTSRKRSVFSTGSHILRAPVYVRPDGQLKHAKPGSGADGWADGWLASWSPPYKYANGPSGLEIDVTFPMLENRPCRDPVEVLYHNRFVLSFDLRAIPEEILERLRANTDSWSSQENTSYPTSSSGCQTEITSRELTCLGQVPV
ncbi:adenine nucleotide alpha hydrolases-like protein [Thelephora ganbajun]|uniref:Adenine nucleotide alpha hydrolases-like protein n=1 Tax=Thelephora ganbajun TaxID=370292 RepID=A0ACB6YZ45_THEGA|nr:adenine nucleotide alpha hydrolases-like protein [Thelephora ganbajun]